MPVCLTRAHRTLAERVDELLDRIIGDKTATSLAIARDCSTMGEPVCKMRISGAADDAARLDLRCDGVTYESCTATIAAGATTADCTSSGTSPVRRTGPFSIDDTVTVGAPTILASGCDFI